ncbi:MAG: hypothetical protein UH083_04030, partial [Ruminococcus sp.]|nr:hypothetical protein [Ruminococcus sp.]
HGRTSIFQQLFAVKIKLFNCYTEVALPKSSASASSATGAFYKNQVAKPDIYLLFNCFVIAQRV